MVTVKPTPEAHSLRCSSSRLVGVAPLNDSTAVKSSKTQVLPIENDPFPFSRALCIRTRPDFRTATIIRRGFLFSGDDSGEGGVDGNAASSIIRMCVMYDSN